MNGKVYLIGAGPGKQDLITVRGLNILREADVVIYDYLVDKQILTEAKPCAELICCDKLGKNRHSDGFLINNEKINELVIKKAREGKKVIRLKNGDPAIFGRLSQELGALVKEKIKFEIVPGITAASAASAFSGIPLTDREFASNCTFVTGHLEAAKKKSFLDWRGIAKAGTIALYMGAENLDITAKNLMAAGKPKNTPVAIVKDASLPTQRVALGLLGSIARKAKQEKIMPPAIIIIGGVATLEKKFNWLKKTKRVFFTGISPERFFRQEWVFHLPLIRIVPLKDYRMMDGLLKGIAGYDWLIFTSRYGVQYFFLRLYEIGYDTRVLKGVKIAAIGGSTKKRLLDFGILPDLTPGEESSYGLINAFKKYDINHKRIFLACSDLSDKGFSRALKAQGAAEVIACVAYKNIMADDLPDLDLSFFDQIIFTSPSTVRNFKARYKAVPCGVKIRCIGKVTAKEADKAGLLNG